MSLSATLTQRIEENKAETENKLIKEIKNLKRQARRFEMEFRANIIEYIILIMLGIADRVINVFKRIGKNAIGLGMQPRTLMTSMDAC